QMSLRSNPKTFRRCFLTLHFVGGLQAAGRSTCSWASRQDRISTLMWRLLEGTKEPRRAIFHTGTFNTLCESMIRSCCGLRRRGRYWVERFTVFGGGKPLTHRGDSSSRCTKLKRRSGRSDTSTSCSILCSTSKDGRQRAFAI